MNIGLSDNYSDRNSISRENYITTKVIRFSIHLNKDIKVKSNMQNS